jgi:putative endonuclease
MSSARASGRHWAGRHWEKVAADYLTAQGLRICYRNYRCRLGELDLVCDDGSTLIIVEVRARRASRYGQAAATVGSAKRQRIVRATRHLLMTHPDWHDRPIRFDVVAADDITANRPRLTWIKGAFDGAD